MYAVCTPAPAIVFRLIEFNLYWTKQNKKKVVHFCCSIALYFGGQMHSIFHLPHKKLFCLFLVLTPGTASERCVHRHHYYSLIINCNATCLTGTSSSSRHAISHRQKINKTISHTKWLIFSFFSHLYGYDCIYAWRAGSSEPNRGRCDVCVCECQPEIRV